VPCSCHRGTRNQNRLFQMLLAGECHVDNTREPRFMTTGVLLSDEQIIEFTRQLRRRARFARQAAVEVLANVAFDQFARPDRLALLLAALNTSELRDKARESLTYALRGMDEAQLASLRPDERRALRLSIAKALPHQHAEFMIAVVRALLHSGDLEAIPALASLMERSAISRRVVRRYANGWGYRSDVVVSFEGTREEEHDTRQVHTATHVAYERLTLLAEQLATKGNLLVPASSPDDDTLVRPASASSSEDANLLRPTSCETDVN
jgi:hypothetical protein